MTAIPVAITKKHHNVDVDRSMRSSGITLSPGMNICQTDLPLDWYQEEFKPYVEEYLALPDRTPETVLPWMDRYIVPALDHFGDSIMLLAHYYMGGEIVKLVERYGGRVADSYELAKQARNNPDKKVFVESAVHFMAETIALLRHDDQEVWITNPKSGCTMEALAKEDMVAPLFDELLARYGEQLMVVCYMNTSGCGCATMSRNDPPHLVAILDLLKQGKAPELNRVLPGDVVDEASGARERLDATSRAAIATDARKALQRMIELTEAAR